MSKKLSISLIIVALAGFLYWRGLDAPVDPNGREQSFTVNQGQSAGEIAFNLKTAGLIRSPFYFKYRVKREGLSLQAGEYSLSPKLDTGEILKLLAAGQALSRENEIKIIEGYDIKDIAVYLENKNLVKTDSFSKLAKAPLKNWQFNFSKPDYLSDAPVSSSLEGYLFPDTYKIFKDATAADIIGKMLRNFDSKLTPALRAEIKRQNKTVFEIVTMASIIEKEVRSKEDMKIVSGIFWDRLKYGIALQSDATLSYILDDKVGGHTVAETKIDSPYNTYKYRGLPPGPIANPGLNAIMAAIYPQFTDYVYFLSDSTGRTIYSKTLEEHNANKAKYLR